jgi:hypothetical protein
VEGAAEFGNHYPRARSLPHKNLEALTLKGEEREGFGPDRTKSMVEGRRRSSTVLSPLLLLLKRMLMAPSSLIILQCRTLQI